ncbi:uncharacterized protein LOC143923837 [Lithobates pipiens]
MLSPSVSGKAVCLWGSLVLFVFLPTWFIANCIYHPEDLGLLKGICGPPKMNNTPGQRHSRSIVPVNESPKGLTNKMLLLKFKYSYAQKSGFEKCWICSKLHPSTARIPLMAVPLNFTPLLNGTPPIVLTNVTRTRPNKTLTFQIIGRSHFPDWCFRLGNTTDGAEVCKQAKLNISMTSFNSPSFFHTSDPTLNATFLDFLSSSTKTTIHQLMSILVLSGLSDTLRNVFHKRPLALGNTIYICCGKLCHPWIPTKPQGWCYLAALVPIMGVLGDNKGSHLLEASMHPRYPLRHRNKRELFLGKDMAWAWFPSWTGWGIDLMKRLNNYTGIIDEILEENSDDITKLNLETRAIRKQLELHELAIESMSAALTGLCETTEDYECCTWIHNTSIEVPDYYDVIAQHREEVNKLQKEARNIGKNWDPFSSSFSFGGLISWLRNAAMTIVTVILFILFLYACYKIIKCLCKKGNTVAPKDLKLTSIVKDPTVWYRNQEHKGSEYEACAIKLEKE